MDAAERLKRYKNRLSAVNDPKSAQKLIQKIEAVEVSFDVLKETSMGTALARWIKLNEADASNNKAVRMAKKLIDRFNYNLKVTAPRTSK